MLSLVIKKEILEHLLSLRFAITCVVCFVVILSSVLVLTKDYKEDILDYHTNLVMHRNEVLEYEYPWRLGQDGIKVDKPLNPMKIFMKGIDRENSTTVRVFSWGEPEFQAGQEGNPAVHLFPTIDFVFFVSIIMSLLAIAFSYDAISGEKESGTLRLMMSYSIPRDVVLLGKWIGGYLALIAPFLISILCGLIVVQIFPEVRLTSDNWLQLACILGVSLLYISAMYSLGILVSARTAMASTSITVLLLIWVLLALVIPNISPYMASQVLSVPSVQSVEKQKAEVQREEIERVQKEFEEWRKKREEEGPIDWNSKEVTEYIRGLREGVIARIAEKQGKVVDDFRKRLDNQVVLARNISRVSPMSPLVYSTTGISGTGTQERDHFLKTVGRYHENLVKYTEDKIEEFQAMQRRRQEGEQEEEQFDPSDYPKFIYDGLPLKDQIQASLVDVLVLAIWNIIFFMGAYVSFLRYDVK